MTTFQDKQPQSRRALRQEERAERPLTEESDAPTSDDSATPRVSGRPTGRRARSNFADGLIEVTSADSADSVPLTIPVPSETDAVAPTEPESDSPADAAADASEETPVWTGPSFGFASLGFDGSNIPPLPSDAEGEEADAADAASEPLDDILSAPEVEDSSVARAFPFAAQVEATSDDEGHQSFTLDEFTPETASADVDQQQGGHELPADWAVAASDSDAKEPDVVEPDAAEPEAEAPEASEPEPAAPEAVEPQAVTPDSVEPEAAATEAAAPGAAEPDESTMTRREWRAWRAQKESAAESAAAPAAEQPVVDEPVADQPAADQPVFLAPDVDAPSAETAIPTLVEPELAPTTALSDAMAEFESLTRGNSGSIEVPAAQAAPDRPAEAPPVASVVPAIFTVPEFSVPVTNIPVPQTPEAAAEPPELPAYEPATAEPASSASASPAPAPAATDSPATDSETTGGTPRVSESSADSAYVPPVGHWSRQAALDDESQPFENTLSRDVGGGNVATTTNALVLPMIPQRDDFSSMINSTGEIMVTGTIDLPMSVGTTGRDSRHYDDPEVDHLFDAFDNEVATTDSAPVRAITAVSSHTATRGGIETGRKQNNRMLTALIVTACVMAVGVFGLLVAGFVFGIF